MVDMCTKKVSIVSKYKVMTLVLFALFYRGLILDQNPIVVRCTKKIMFVKDTKFNKKL